MDKELKRLVVEIISLVLLLIIIVPICADASSNYRIQKETLLNGAGITVDMAHNGDMKKITIYSNHDKPVRVGLFLKISKFYNEYEIYLDGKTYDIRDFSCTADGDNLYFNLGIYEVNQYRDFDFKLNVKGSLYYDETITYSFITEGLL